MNNEAIEKELLAARRAKQLHKEANLRYLATQETITIHCKPEVKAEMQKRAKEAGLSMKQFIVKRCLE